MDNIIIFSGTTEGRTLSEMLSEEGIRHFVCVATGYGSDIMEESRFAIVHTGRMDAKEIEEYLSENGFSEGDIVVDATHPYAEAVGDNISLAAERLGLTLFVVERGKGTGMEESYVNHLRSMEEFAGYIEGTEGNILLTTGSKDLAAYCENVSKETINRTYVRIIPAAQSLEKCESLGISSSHVIAAQGPFSYDMNRSMIHHYNIAHLFTKDSGDTGGFEEKIRAARDTGAVIYVLDRPESAAGAGMSIYEAYERITGKAFTPKRQIILAGAGPGGKNALTVDVSAAIRSADAVFGAPGVIKNISAKRKYGMYLAEDIKNILEKEKSIKKAVVLFSGDSGFYSGAKKAYEDFAEWDGAESVTVMPGISSVSYLAAKLGISYDDARIVSVHGNNGLHNISKLVHTILHNRKTFALLSDAGDLSKVAERLSLSSASVRIFTGRDMSGEDEKIECMSAGEAISYNKDGKITALFINDKPEKRRVINSLTDDELIREKVPMTKEIVRHESIARLRLCEDDLFLDIGGGTGSVAIEAASLDPSLKVITIEKEHEAVLLIKRNIEKLGVDNVSVIEGDAVDIIPTLPCPDCVFIGGSGGELDEIIDLLCQKGEGIRCVINAVSLETIEETGRILREKNINDVRCSQISVSDIEPVGAHHMMKANNPVTVFSFTL